MSKSTSTTPSIIGIERWNARKQLGRLDLRLADWRTRYVPSNFVLVRALTAAERERLVSHDKAYEEATHGAFFARSNAFVACGASVEELIDEVRRQRCVPVLVQ